MAWRDAMIQHLTRRRFHTGSDAASEMEDKAKESFQTIWRKKHKKEDHLTGGTSMRAPCRS